MTPPLTYHNVVPSPSRQCGICLQNLTKDAVDHEGDFHPFHRTCIKTWLVRSATCPICRQNVDPSFFYTWWDKSIIWLKGGSKPSFVAFGLAVGAWTATGLMMEFKNNADQFFQNKCANNAHSASGVILSAVAANIAAQASFKLVQNKKELVAIFAAMAVTCIFL